MSGRELKDADLAKLLTTTPARGGVAHAPPGRRLFVRLVILAVASVVAWFTLGERMLEPLAERVRVHTATTRVASHREEILAACARLDMDPNLIGAIVFAESSGAPGWRCAGTCRRSARTTPRACPPPA